MKNRLKVLPFAFLFALTVSSCALPKFPIGNDNNDNSISSSSQNDPTSSFEEENSTLESSETSSSLSESSSAADNAGNMQYFLNELNNIPLDNVIDEFNLARFYKKKEMNEPKREGPLVNNDSDIISYVYDDREIFGLSSQFLTFSNSIKEEYKFFKDLLTINIFSANDNDFRHRTYNGERVIAFKKFFDEKVDFYSINDNGSYNLIGNGYGYYIYSFITSNRFYYYREYRNVNFLNGFHQKNFPNSCFNTLIYLEKDRTSISKILYHHFAMSTFIKDEVKKNIDGSVKYISTSKSSFSLNNMHDIITFKDDYILSLDFDLRYYSNFYSYNPLRIFNNDPNRGLWTAQIQYLGDGYVSLHPRDNLLAVDAKLLNDVIAMTFSKDLVNLPTLYNYFGEPGKSLITSTGSYNIDNPRIVDKLFPMCSYLVSSGIASCPYLAKRLELGGKIASDNYLNMPFPQLINALASDYNNRLDIHSSYEEILSQMSLNRFKDEEYLISLSDEDSLRGWANTPIQELLDPSSPFKWLKELVENIVN